MIKGIQVGREVAQFNFQSKLKLNRRRESAAAEIPDVSESKSALGLPPLPDKRAD